MKFSISRSARDDEALSYVAAFADPWPGPLAIWRMTFEGGYEQIAIIEKRATIGETLDVLRAGPVGRFDKGDGVTVKIGAGHLSSVGDLAALAGRTAMAIRVDGEWEIFAFAHAELVGEKTYRLSRLIRGLGGEEHLAKLAMRRPARPVVLLNDAIAPLARKVSEIGAPMTYRIGPADRDYAEPIFVQPTVARDKQGVASLRADEGARAAHAGRRRHRFRAARTPRLRRLGGARHSARRGERILRSRYLAAGERKAHAHRRRNDRSFIPPPMNSAISARRKAN